MAAFGLSFVLALSGQLLLDSSPRDRVPLAGIALYGLAAMLGLVALWLGRHRVGAPEPAVSPGPKPSSWVPGLPWLVLSAGAAALAFLDSGGNRFRLPGTAAWLVAVVAWFAAWWREPVPVGLKTVGQTISVRWEYLLAAGILLIGILFRYWDLNNLPRDVNSDHAEKLLDVWDVLRGEYRVFFPRNTGREAMQFYIAAATVEVFSLPVHKYTLQIGTAFIGVLLLPALYLLGNSLWGRPGGLWTMFFGAVASWAVIPARVGLRYPFLPTFAAWSLAFLVRGLRSGRRSDFLWMGLFLGLGLYGYSPFRGMLAALPAAFLVVWLLRRGWQTADGRRLAGDFSVGMLTALPVTAPMLRFAVDNPNIFFGRVFTRVSTWERPIEGDPVSILADNLARALLMFHWTGDEVYVATLPLRPMLDPVLGALLVLGLLGAVVWVSCRRDPVPLAVIAGGLVMLLPSALNLAFPRENPSTVRAAGALPAVLALAALPPTLWLRADKGQGLPLRGVRLLTMVILILALVRFNVDRVFVAYAEAYCQRVLHASEAAELIAGFYRLTGTRGAAFYVAYPYWFDSRLIGMWLGDLDWPDTILSQDLPTVLVAHLRQAGPKLYLVHPNDQASLRALAAAYPRGVLTEVPRQGCPGDGTIAFWVPAR
jgi:hypothetical protein